MTKKLIVAAGLSLLMLGCEDGVGPAGNVDGSFGTAVKGAVDNFVGTLAAGPMADPNGDVQLPAMFASAFDGCTRFSKGTSISNDDYAVTYNCRGIAGVGVTTDLIGTMKRSAVDGDFTKGYRFDVDLYNKSVFPEGDFVDVYKGFSEMKKTATQLRYSSDFEMHIRMDNHKPPVDWMWKRSVSKITTPDDMSDVAAGGAVAIEGGYLMEGRVGGGPGGVDLGISKFGFSVKSNSLRYETGCSTFKSGTLTFVDGASNKIVYDFDCNSKEITLNGKLVN